MLRMRRPAPIQQRFPISDELAEAGEERGTSILPAFAHGIPQSTGVNLNTPRTAHHSGAVLTFLIVNRHLSWKRKPDGNMYEAIYCE